MHAIDRAGTASPRRVAVRLAVTVAAGLVLFSGCSTSESPDRATATDTGIGSWPTFLPSPSAAPMAHGSAGSPAMSYPGSPVIVAAGAGDVRVDLEGPAYPPDTKVGADRVRCTFAVRFSGASATVGLGQARFDVLDHTGVVHPLTIVSGPMPTSIEPGQTVAVRLMATLPSGEGLVRFSPGGTATAAGWDYVAETD